MEKITIAELNHYSGMTVNPLDDPDKMFELYSVPSYEKQYPEVIKGSEIGSSKITVEENDVLICKINPRINRVWVVKRHTPYTLLASSEWIPIRNDNCDPSYLKWYFSSPVFRNLLTSQVAGIGGSLTRAQPKQVSKYPVPLVKISEQRRIAATLDKVTDLISKRRQQLDKLDELAKARFVEMFGDPFINPYHLPTAQFGSVLSVQPQNGLYKPQSNYVTDSLGVPILRIDGFYDGKVTDFRNFRRLKCSSDEIIRFSLCENDIVINRVNSIEYLGKCALIKGLLETTVYESNMMRLHVDEKRLNARYVTQLLCSKYIYNQILNRAKKAVNQASINQKDVQSLLIYIPPLELQDQFATFTKQIDQVKANIGHSLAKLEMLKKALMQEYFG